MIEMVASDERPYWEATIVIEGLSEDLSTGHTFRVAIGSTPQVVKTTGITGSTAGVVTVAWAVAELAIRPGTYPIQLTVTRTADNRDWTIEDEILIKRRL